MDRTDVSVDPKHTCPAHFTRRQVPVGPRANVILGPGGVPARGHPNRGGEVRPCRPLADRLGSDPALLGDLPLPHQPWSRAPRPRERAGPARRALHDMQPHPSGGCDLRHRHSSPPLVDPPVHDLLGRTPPNAGWVRSERRGRLAHPLVRHPQAGRDGHHTLPASATGHHLTDNSRRDVTGREWAHRSSPGRYQPRGHPVERCDQRHRRTLSAQTNPLRNRILDTLSHIPRMPPKGPDG